MYAVVKLVVNSHRGTPWAQVGHTGEDKHARDVPFLYSYANKQWEVSNNSL